jgi:hypothetical protein
MLRLTLVLGLLGSLLVAGFAAPADAAKKRKRTACERLAGRDLAPARKLKVVKRTRGDEITVRACTLRGGRVRTLASFSPASEFDSGSIDVTATTDRFVLLAETYTERGSGHSLARVDARSRKRTVIATSSCDPMQFCTGEAIDEVVLHPTGAVVAVIRGYPPCCTTPPPAVAARVVLVAADGTRTVLDEAPQLGSLGLEGDEVVWSRGGQPQRARVVP